MGGKLGGMARTIDTGSDDLLARVEGNVGIITFNRPERYNAFDNAMSFEFIDALKEAARST